jgi:hypothetical protein
MWKFEESDKNKINSFMFCLQAERSKTGRLLPPPRETQKQLRGKQVQFLRGPAAVSV